MGYSPDHHGGWCSVLIPGGEPLGPWLRSIENHPGFASPAEGDGAITGFLVSRAACRTPQPTSEKPLLTTGGQVTSQVPPLGLFHTWASPVPVPELGSICQWSSLSRAFRSLASWLTGLATFLDQMESAAIYPWRLVRREESPGAAVLALYEGQAVSTTGETVGETAWLPLVHRPVPRCPFLQEGQPEADTGGFPSLIPSDAAM